MKIGFVVENFGNMFRGGAEVQYEKTYEALKKMGIDVNYISRESKELKEYDIYHFFKSFDFSWELVKALKREKIPYIVSTIYLPSRYNLTKFIYKYFVRLLPLKLRTQFVLGQRYEFWRNAKYLCPNTSYEANFFKDLGFNNIKIVYNGIDLEEVALNNQDRMYELYPQFKDMKYVLNVGRVEDRKNQILLVKACKELNVPLIIIGKIANRDYLKEIEKINYEKCHLLGAIYDKEILNAFYKDAEIFALPSILETPGLAALEAMYYNSKILITNNGGTEDYFEDMVEYCNPNRYESILIGLKKLLEDNDKNYSSHVASKFTWENVVKEYIELYNKSINQ